MSFNQVKARYLERLLVDARRGAVDSDILDWLFKVNDARCLATTSSCSGRVAILYGDSLTDKAGSRILEVWHNPGECRRRICRIVPDGMYTWWSSLQPPIVHFLADSLEAAEEVLKCGDRAGFSKLGYRLHRTGYYHVEAGGGDKLHIILPAPCNILLSQCNMLQLYKERLEKFMECLLGVCR